jgi:FkbM family methyltransferase
MVGAGNRSCWVGVYEWNKQLAFASQLDLGDVVFDIGAHAGFYTLLAARLAGPTGQVVAFEPDPNNLMQLRRHLHINRLANVTVIAAAVSDKGGSHRFQREKSSLQGRLDPSGDIVVATLDLDTLWINGTVPAPRLIKIDVEGEEVAVIRGATKLLVERRPVVMVAAHSATLRAECDRALQSCGYVVECLDGHSESDELIAVHAEPN